MIHSTVAQSTGLQGTINYLFQADDSKGVRRNSIELIRGDFDSMLVREKSMNGNTVLHTTLDFTANENNQLSAQDKEDILDSFIEQLATGLPSPDRLTYAVVEHDKNMPKAHYHIVALREDNETQKKYEPWVIQRNDIKRFHTWNDVMTDRFNLENPDDVPKITSAMGKKKRRSKDNQKITDKINQEIEVGFTNGQIDSRDDVIALLEKDHDMKITRKNAYSLSFKNDDMKQAIKLDSFACSAKFINRDAAIAYQGQRKERPSPNIAIEKLEKFEDKVKSYHEGRYDVRKVSYDASDSHGASDLLKAFIDSMDVYSDDINIAKHNPTLCAQLKEVSWEEALDVAKTYDANDVSDDELWTTDNELERDYDYISKYNEVQKARINIDQQAKQTNQPSKARRKVAKEENSIIAKQVSSLENISKERDNVCNPQSKSFENFSKKHNPSAPKP